MKTLPIISLMLFVAAGVYAQPDPVATPAQPNANGTPVPPPLVTASPTLPPQAELVMQTPDNLRPGPALNALDPVVTSGSIVGWMFESRDQEASALEMRIGATASAVEALKSSVGEYSNEAPFRAATMAVRVAEDQLRKTVKAARVATPEKWADARAKVSVDFKAYADAVTKTERLVAANGQPNA